MRKGQVVLGYKWIYFIIAIFLITTMFLGLRGVLLKYQSGSIECIDGVVDEVMIAKSLYSPNCFVYTEGETGRAHPGTIDLEKFTNKTFENCFKYITKKAQLSIDDKIIGVFIYNPKEIRKPIFTYSSGNIEPATLKFTFAEASC